MRSKDLPFIFVSPWYPAHVRYINRASVPWIYVLFLLFCKIKILWQLNLIEVSISATLDYLPFSLWLTFSATVLIYCQWWSIFHSCYWNSIHSLRLSTNVIFPIRFSHVPCYLATKGNSDWFLTFRSNFQSVAKCFMCLICKYNICLLALGYFIYIACM